MKANLLNWRVLSLVTLAAAMATSCSSDEPELPTQSDPIVLSRSEGEVMRAQSDFAFRLLGEMIKENPGENIGFSPFCVQQALSMLGNGVTGGEQARYADAFGMSDINEMNRLNVRLNAALPYRDPENVTVEIANGVWLNEAYDINPDFVGVMRESYAAESESYDFGKVNIADIANKWIAGKTRNGIKNLIPAFYNRNPQTIFVLANALYFNGKWREKFQRSETKPRAFTDSYGKNGKDVPTMHSSQILQYAGYGHFSIFCLPFGQDWYRMLIVLPDEGYTPADVLKEMAEAKIGIGNMLMHTVESDIYLPKFNLRANDEITDEISGAGLPLDEFSYGNLCPDVAEVKSYQGFDIRVDEDGAEIKAAAVETGMATACPFDPGPELRVNRPFIFAVYEVTGNAILGMGVINDPTK